VYLGAPKGQTYYSINTKSAHLYQPSWELWYSERQVILLFRRAYNYAPNNEYMNTERRRCRIC
jgi:hypothetical protein